MAVSVIEIVIEMDLFLAFFPAKIHELFVMDVKKIHDSLFKVSQKTAGLIDFKDVFFERKDEGLKLRGFFEIFTAVMALIVMNFLTGYQIQHQKLVVMLLHPLFLARSSSISCSSAGISELASARVKTLGFVATGRFTFKLFFSHVRTQEK